MRFDAGRQLVPQRFDADAVECCHSETGLLLAAERTEVIVREASVHLERDRIQVSQAKGGALGIESTFFRVRLDPASAGLYRSARRGPQKAGHWRGRDTGQGPGLGRHRRRGRDDRRRRGPRQTGAGQPVCARPGTRPLSGE